MKRIVFLALAALTAVLIMSGLSAGDLSAQKPAKQNVCIVLNADIHCNNCVRKIENAIPFEKGIKDVSVDLEARQVEVVFDPAKTDPDKILKAFEKIKVETEVESIKTE